MKTLIFLAREPSLQRLGWVLIHFLWQGAGIGLALASLLPLLNRASAHLRYLVICGALLACAIAPMVTWVVLERQETVPFQSRHATNGILYPVELHSDEPSIAPPPIAPSSSFLLPVTGSEPRPITSWRILGLQLLNQLVPYALVFWFGGVSVLTVRLAVGWAGLQRLRRSGAVIRDSAWLERFCRLAERMRVSAPVRLLQSAFVEVPTLIGWLRPVILLPAAVFTGLTPEQLEAVLAHELAHVRRCDYLVNLLQTVIETALFYHPAVWWISRRLREEREVCCDDIVLEVMQDRLVYVSALASLEEARGTPMVLAACGGSLIRRIRRMAEANDRKATAWPLFIVMVGVLIVTCLSKGAPSESLTSAELLVRQALNFRLVNSIEYRLSCDVTSVEDGGYHVNVHWLEKGGSFRYTWEQLDTGSRLTSEIAFDGKLFQEFPAAMPPGFAMVLKKGIVSSEIKLNEDQFLTSPFSFVRNGKGLPFRPLNILADPKTFTTLDLVDTKPTTVQKDGKGYACLSFKAGSDPDSGKPRIRRVYFSKENGYYPMISELVCEGTVIGRYQVMQLGIIQNGNDNRSFVYPKEAKALYYDGAPEPSAVYTYKISDVKLNQVADDAFVLDRGSVSKIWDVDQWKYISIPKAAAGNKAAVPTVASPADSGDETNAARRAFSSPASGGGQPRGNQEFSEIKLHVWTSDGTPPSPAFGYYHIEIGSGQTGEGGPFSDSASGTIAIPMASYASKASFAVVKEGYATAFAGPFTPPIQQKLDGCRFTLNRGSTASIEMVDEEGKPVAGATLKAYYPGPPLVVQSETTTNTAGAATFAHIGSAPLNVLVHANGYQSDEISNLDFNTSQPYRWVLKKGLLLRGTVTAAATGKQIAGAAIKLAGMRGPHKETYSDPPNAPLLATTDERGGFTLKTLRPDSRYFLFVEAPGYGGIMLNDIKASQAELKAALGPELVVRGKVINIGRWATVNGEIHVGYNQYFQIDNSASTTGRDLVLKPANGEAGFVTGPLYQCPVEIGVEGAGMISLKAKDLPVTDLIIDLAPHAAKEEQPAAKGSPALLNAPQDSTLTSATSAATVKLLLGAPATSLANALAPQKLRSGGIDPNESFLELAASEGHDEIVDSLLKKGAYPTCRALNLAVVNSSPYRPNEPTKEHFGNTIKLLIDAGGIKGLTTEKTTRLLCNAILSGQPAGNPAIVKMLLDAGVDPAPVKEFQIKGGTLMDMVRDASRKSEGYKEILDLLEKADAALRTEMSVPTGASPAAATNGTNAFVQPPANTFAQDDGEKILASIASHQAQYFASIKSVEYTIVSGSEEGMYFTRMNWKEMGGCYYLDFHQIRKNENFDVHRVESYDGERGYNYIPGAGVMRIQRRPFPVGVDALNAGPFIPFQFLLLPKRQAGIMGLKANLESAMTRATLQPSKNRSWYGHPSIAVKFSDAYDPRTLQTVEYTVYFATDCDLYPIAWDMYSKSGEYMEGYRVQEFKTIRVKEGNSTVLVRYPGLVSCPSQIAINILKKMGVPGADQDPDGIPSPDIKINHLKKADFELDLSRATIINDMDTKSGNGQQAGTNEQASPASAQTDGTASGAAKKAGSTLSDPTPAINEVSGQSPLLSPIEGSEAFARYAFKLRESSLLKIEPEVLTPAKSPPNFFGSGGRYPWKVNIVTTVLWVGQPGGGKSSAWDPEWETHYGGADNPAPSARRDYIPIKFTPRLNPFYCALPYNDVTQGTTKPEAAMVIPWFKTAYKKSGVSVCRNRWIEIRNHSGQTCYAQWSDCGPVGTDQWQYVFGNDRPTWNIDHGAGLEVSPAVRDFLGLSGMDVTSWRFVDCEDVTTGPWSEYGDNNDFVMSAKQNIGSK
jgi:hypothetical protein